MIIRRIILESFGGVQQRIVNFAAGLNVVLGPNEAGKTTLVNALFAVLFLPSNIRRSSREWTGSLARFMPAGGGDTIAVTVEFVCRRGDTYTLSRSWGETRACRLTVAGGGTFTGEDSVKERLAELLVLGKGTYEGVLFARQDDMLKTVEDLRANREAANTLGDALRAALFEAGGVSLDALAQEIEEAKKDLLSNWELSLDGPKNNRGVDNPYSNNVGRLLAGYYRVERLTRSLRAAGAAEERMEGAMAALESVLREAALLEPQLIALESIEGEMRKRSVLAAEAARLEAAVEKIRQINAQWPKLEERLLTLNAQAGQDGLRMQALQAELLEARAEGEARRLREMYTAVGPFIEALREATDKAEEYAAITPETVRQLERSTAVISRREAELRAMKLVGRLEVVSPLFVKVVSGLEEIEEHRVDKEAVFTGDGRLCVQAAEWVLEVQAGQEDVAAILAEISAQRLETAQNLQLLKADSIAEVKTRLAAKEALLTEAGRLQAKADGMLAGLPFAELAAKVAALPAAKAMREADAIVSELAGLQATARQSAESAEQLRAQLAQWEEAYGSYDAVMDKLADLRGEQRDLQAQIAALSELPAQFNGEEEFFLALNELRKRSKDVGEAAARAREELARAQREAPDVTVEELAQEQREAEERLQRLKKEAQALCEVEAAFRQVKQNLDQNTYEPFVRAFGRYLPQATGSRYHTARLEGALPQQLLADDGRELPVEYLSTGTNRGIALALRLAMAEFFLEGAQGFLVMDDPLVDLDPQRKGQAARMLRAYASERQIIITTCDPETAGLLGGNCITLD